MALKVEGAAPDSTLPHQMGEQVALGRFQGQRAVVLYFYPKGDSPGCTV